MTVRSVLCVPAHDLHKVRGCRRYGADLILFDLEDSIPAGAKDQAIHNLSHATPMDAVRISTPVDIEKLPRLVRHIWIPKVESIDDIIAATAVGWAGRITALIESPRGILNATSIAASAAVSGLAFGRYDFMAATGMVDVQSPLIDHAMGHLALAAHANRIPVSDAPCYSLDSSDGLVQQEIARARGFGFNSKGCIHPSQVPFCAALGPTADDLEWARGVPSAAMSGSGAVRDNGRLIGPPMVKLASRLLVGEIQGKSGGKWIIRAGMTTDLPLFRDLALGYLSEMRDKGSEVIPSDRTIDFYCGLFMAVTQPDSSLGAAAVAIDDAGRTVGFSLASDATPAIDTDLGRTATGWGTYVVPEYRGRRLADLLRKELRIHLRRLGFQTVVGGTRSDDIVATSSVRRTNWVPWQLYGLDDLRRPEPELVNLTG